jgi:hypothetical protein
MLDTETSYETSRDRIADRRISNVEGRNFVDFIKKDRTQRFHPSSFVNRHSIFDFSD